MDEAERWWEPRREGEATSEYLARVLDDIGTHDNDMARRARLYHFDDYFCPPEVDDGANINRLVTELEDIARSASRDRRSRIRAVVDAAKVGEFDGTRAESIVWARSPDGQATFRALLEGR